MCQTILFVLLTAGLVGCKDRTASERVDNYLNPMDIEPIDDDEGEISMSQQPLPHRLYDSPRINVNEVAGIAPRMSTHVDVANEQTMNYYTTLCDVYWKLNWMRKELRHGSVPYNMEDEIEKARKNLETVTHNGDYDLAAEALDRLEKGLEHLACLRTLQAAHIDDRGVPWETDTAAVAEYLDRGAGDSARIAPIRPAIDPGLDVGDDEPAGFTQRKSSPDAIPSASHEQAVSLAQDYESQYHTSPRELMRREWETAIRKINRLRDNLSMQNREQNKDGDGTDVSTAVSLAANSSTSIHMPPDAGKSVVAPTRVIPRT